MTTVTEELSAFGFRDTLAALQNLQADIDLRLEALDINLSHWRERITNRTTQTTDTQAKADALQTELDAGRLEPWRKIIEARVTILTSLVQAWNTDRVYTERELEYGLQQRATLLAQKAEVQDLTPLPTWGPLINNP